MNSLTTRTLNSMVLVGFAALAISSLLCQTAHAQGVNSPTSRDNPARQAFQASCEYTSQLEAWFGCRLTNVPAGKRLVIETVSGRIAVPPGGAVLWLYLVTTAAGVRGEHHLAATRMGTYTGDLSIPMSVTDMFVSNHSVRLYADPGTPVEVYGMMAGQQAVYRKAVATISGYFVDLN